mmetsp:Transcript_23302/g.36339  ORF Transcript_23302/g.36339 Transcript_23302/m.36339 type:complete len:726 (-) Transcript_23302:63-2240(-)|eukprot:CAMPEP_0201523794 /NCGR_PEP_ID=MMETSP0161_2-20130828/20915_1 /ASSEMBLY_ACC=CAM_ASM_000251 /TAXON_ID=180227 /ORGANISM="Neoparamoeba aestuarina, Strain SoJaBio B1-5/56/2" /LENGTH=725 /DNA_ID=CAMNT_0047923007 /DNA_START=78 /DNA_END=2255 /DNA_ORIENTATION=+
MAGKTGKALGKAFVVLVFTCSLFVLVTLFPGPKNIPSYSAREETQFVKKSDDPQFYSTPIYAAEEEDEEDWCPRNAGDTEPVSGFETRACIIVIVTILIALSIFFEEVREGIDEHSDELVKPIIEHTWEELTVLGFLSLLSFLIVFVGATRRLACLLGFDEEEALDEMVESVHMLLFFIMVLFIIFVFLMVKMGRFLEAEWQRNEELCQRPKHLAEQFIEAQQTINNRGFGIHSFLPKRLDPPKRVVAATQYMGMRNAFINPRDSTHRVLPPDFDFKYYLSLLLGELLGEIVEITVPVWMALEVVLLVLWGLSFLEIGAFCLVWVGLGWCFLVWGMGIYYSLWQVRENVTPEVTSVSFSNAAGSLNADHGGFAEETSKLLKEEMRSHAVEDKYAKETVYLQSIRPPYLSFTLSQRSDLGKRLFGKPPNKHEMCFPFDRHGVHFYLQSFRLILVVLSLYIALTCVHFGPAFYDSDNFDIATGTILLILCLVPIFIVAGFCMPRSIVNLVITSNIEKMRKKEMISKVLRDMHTRKALKLLTMLQMMQFYTRKSKVGLVKDDKAADKRDPGLGDNLSPEKREDLREVFEMFDADGSGYVDSQELMDILSLLGEEITEKEALDLIATIDEDGDKRMNFNEFCSFMSLQQHSHPDHHIEDMLESLFSIFDKDGSGSVSSVEFRETMARVCRGKLEEEDLDMVIEDIDKDDDGEIDLKEFEEMLKFYLKQG